MAVILLIILGTALYGLFKPIPENTSYEGEIHSAENVSFLFNRSINENGKRIFEEQIFSSIFDAVEDAEEMIVMDIFLFNNMEEGDFPEVSGRTAEALINKKGQSRYINHSNY